MNRATLRAHLSAMSGGDTTVIAGYIVRAYVNPEGRRAFRATARGRVVEGKAKQFVQAFASAIGEVSDRALVRRA